MPAGRPVRWRARPGPECDRRAAWWRTSGVGHERVASGHECVASGARV